MRNSVRRLLLVALLLGFALGLACGGHHGATDHVVVRVHQAGTRPIAGAVVVRQGADGLVLGSALTGADGSATLPIAAGDSITGLWTQSQFGFSFHEIETWVGVKP